MSILKKMLADYAELGAECRGIDKSTSDAGHRVCSCRSLTLASPKLNRRKQRYVTETWQINTAASEMHEGDKDKLFHITKKTTKPCQTGGTTPPTKTTRRRRRRTRLVEIGWPRAQHERIICVPLAICSVLVLMIAAGAWFQCQGSSLGECP